MPDPTLVAPKIKSKGLTAPWASRITGHGDVDPKTLVTNPSNWRSHPSGQAKALAAALGQVGWVAPATVNRTSGRLIDGHLRVEMAISRGEPTIPVTYVDLSDDDERLVLATLDPIGAMATADQQKLADLLRDLTPTDEGLQALLQALADRNGITRLGLTDPDDPQLEPVQAETFVKAGDLWLLGQHRILCGDSTNPGDVARLMDGQIASLMATDPPYLMDYKADNHPQSWANKAAVKDKHWDDYKDPAATVAFFRAFIEAALPHLIPDAVVYQWHADLRRHLVVQAWEECGLLFHQPLVWVKARPILTRSHFMWQHEVCAYGWVKGNQPKRRPPANAKTVWEVDQIGESDGIHPTQKPVELFRRPIAWHTDAGDIVYEPFSGSGTQIIAAEEAGRRCFAMEIEPAYVQIAIGRFQRFTGKQAVRDG